MFRRIELIAQMPAIEWESICARAEQLGLGNTFRPAWKSGLMGASLPGVAEEWASMQVPRRRIFRNCRFYFTEKGWMVYGRPTVAACQRVGQGYRVIRIKEKSVDVVYRDEIQVAVRPKKKKNNTGGPDASR